MTVLPLTTTHQLQLRTKAASENAMVIWCIWNPQILLFSANIVNICQNSTRFVPQSEAVTSFKNAFCQCSLSIYTVLWADKLGDQLEMQSNYVAFGLWQKRTLNKSSNASLHKSWPVTSHNQECCEGSHKNYYLSESLSRKENPSIWEAA